MGQKWFIDKLKDHCNCKSFIKSSRGSLFNFEELKGSLEERGHIIEGALIGIVRLQGYN